MDRESRQRGGIQGGGIPSYAIRYVADFCPTARCAQGQPHWNAAYKGDPESLKAIEGVTL